MEQIQYLILAGDGLVVGTQLVEDPGPVQAPPECPIPDVRLVRFDGEFTREGRRDSESAYLVGDEIVWMNSVLLDQLRADKANAISAACRARIERGFECAALGGVYLYPANAQDQANLVASVTDSLLAGGDPDWRTPFWCADLTGEQWEFRPHTIDQIQQVGREGKASILAAMQKNEVLQRQIAVASAEQLETITW